MQARGELHAPAIVLCLHDEEASVRAQALEAIGAMPRKAQEALRGILACLQDPNPYALKLTCTSKE